MACRASSSVANIKKRESTRVISISFRTRAFTPAEHQVVARLVEGYVSADQGSESG